MVFLYHVQNLHFMQKKLIRILARALHEYVNFVHDSEKQYRSLSACWNTGVVYLTPLAAAGRMRLSAGAGRARHWPVESLMAKA